MKLRDYASHEQRLLDLIDRLKKNKNFHLFDLLEHEKFMKLYIEINVLNLITAFIVLAAAIYVKVTMRTNKIFNETTYKRFIAASFVALMIFLL